MVRIESSFTLEQLIQFSKDNYEAFGTKSRLRKHAYYRQIAAYIALEGGYKIGEVAKALSVSHPTIIWSREQATGHLTSRDETFYPYYVEFVNKFNNHLNNELPAAVNEGQRVDA